MNLDDFLEMKETSNVEIREEKTFTLAHTLHLQLQDIHTYVHTYIHTYPGVPHAVSVGSRSRVFLANPKSAIFMSESSVSKRPHVKFVCSGEISNIR